MRKNRILIVEDDEAIARMVAMNLKVAGYDTRIFFRWAGSIRSSSGGQ